MRVAREAPATDAGRLMVKLKAQGEEKGEDKLDKCLAIVNQLEVGGFIVEALSSC